VVVGAAGEDITTDRYGCIKVQFFWDREGKKDENSSCFIRVAQNWAGRTWGGLVTPRIGQEVIVQFINGDPDWPIITGTVYNASNMPPYDLPSEATRSTFKTRSSVGGTAADYNELRFEDRNGSEEVYLRAQKDHTTEVVHDETKTVGKNYSLTAKAGSVDISAATNITLRVGANSIVIDQEGIQIRSVDLISVSAGAAMSIATGAAISMEVGAEWNVTTGAAFTVEAGLEIALTGTDVTITAADGAVKCIPFPI
jgi:type VI secretion system secreted protein VgrG